MKEYTSIKVVSYALPDFLFALLNNAISEDDFVVTKEDGYLVVRIYTEALSKANSSKKTYNDLNINISPNPDIYDHYYDAITISRDPNDRDSEVFLNTRSGNVTLCDNLK